MKESPRNDRHLERVKIMSCNVPRLLPYHKMMEYVKSIDIGSIGNVKDFCEDLAECYRHLSECLPLLASFYLKMPQKDLIWFSNQVNTFHVVLGGDGAPFGKDKTAFAFFVSFLNIGKSESCGVVQNYVKYACKQMKDLEGTVFATGGFHVTFKFKELPNDMKMLAT